MGIDLDTDIASLAAHVTGIGGINITEIDAITLTDLTTADGDISVTSLRDGIAVGTVNAGAGTDNVTLDARANGSITDTNGTATNVTAANLDATAGHGISLDTRVATMTAHVLRTGDIDIDEFDGITFTDVDAFRGDITLTTGGTTILTDVDAFDGDIVVDAGGDTTLTDVKAKGTITVTADGLVTGTRVDSSNHGDISITGVGVVAGLITAGEDYNVTLDAGTGAITDGNGAALNIIANILTATAEDGINLDTYVTSVTADVTGTGDLVLREINGITLTDLATANGAITVTSGGPMWALLVDSSATGDGTNDITLTAGGTGIRAGTINAGANDVFLRATTGAIVDATDDSYLVGPRTLITGHNIDLHAYSYVGLAENPLELFVTTPATGSVTITTDRPRSSFPWVRTDLLRGAVVINDGAPIPTLIGNQGLAVFSRTGSPFEYTAIDPNHILDPVWATGNPEATIGVLRGDPRFKLRNLGNSRVHSGWFKLNDANVDDQRPQQ